MPVKKDEQGRRYVEAAVDVPGSPEDVWRAIATGKGISSWFVPTTSDERAGGSVVSSFGPGMDAAAAITSWNPPHSFSAESEGGPGTVATEWIVEARGGGTCRVRVVHRWFADSDDWDGEYEGHARGWAASFFRILKLYLTHYSGRECSAFDLAAFSKASAPETWQTFRSGLTIDEQARRVTSTPGTPELSGAIESLETTDPELLLRLDRPAPGIAHAFVMPMGGQTMLSVRFFLYGDRAAAGEAQRAWDGWLAERFGQEMAE